MTSETFNFDSIQGIKHDGTDGTADCSTPTGLANSYPTTYLNPNTNPIPNPTYSTNPDSKTWP